MDVGETKLETPEKLEEHLKRVHQKTFASRHEAYVHRMLVCDYTSSWRIPASACPFCDYEGIMQAESGRPGEQITVTCIVFSRHLGEHLKHISLLALPMEYLIVKEKRGRTFV